jgi:hypothetical protein
MKVNVTSCYGDRSYYRFSFCVDHFGNNKEEYFRINGEEWSRKIASEALDIMEQVYGFARNKIRFIHK